VSTPPHLGDGSLFLEPPVQPPALPNRPWNQGDIFEDVSVSVVVNEAVQSKKYSVMLLGYPCVIYRGSKLAPSQTVGLVRPKADIVTSAMKQFEPPWDSYKNLFPLPQFQTSADYVVDLRQVYTVATAQLDGKRTACLSHEGWAALQKRFAWHWLRIDLPLQQRMSDTLERWNELLAWHRWGENGLTFEAFQPWLKGPLGLDGSPYRGTPRNEILEMAVDDVMGDFPAAGDGTQMDPDQQ